MLPKNFRHRPGLFKQQNKRFKNGRHRTQHQLKRNSKGSLFFFSHLCRQTFFHQIKGRITSKSKVKRLKANRTIQSRQKNKREEAPRIIVNFSIENKMSFNTLAFHLDVDSIVKQCRCSFTR